MKNGQRKKGESKTGSVRLALDHFSSALIYCDQRHLDRLILHFELGINRIIITAAG